MADGIPDRLNHGGSGWHQLAALSLAHFVVDFSCGLVVPLQTPTLTTHLGVTLDLVAALVGFFALAVNVLQPASGLALRNREIPWLLIGSPLLAAAVAFIGFCPNYWGTGALLLTTAAGVAVFHPEGMLAAHAASGTRQHLGIPVFISAGFMGNSFGGLVSGWWANARGLHGFWLLALPAVLASLALAASGVHRLEGHTAEAPKAEYRHGLGFGWVLLLGFAVAVSVVFAFNLLPIAMVHALPHEAQPQKWAGTALFCMGFCGAVGSYAWGALGRRWSLFGLVAASQLLGLLPAWLLLHAVGGGGSVGPILLAAGLFGLTAGSTFPLMVILAREATGLDPRLRAAFIMGGSWGVASVLYMATAPLLRDAGNAVHIMTAIVPAFLLLAAAIGVVCLRRAGPLVAGRGR